jgi:diaminopimelate epimerase
MTPFLKMHGAGNDFVVFDARQNPISLSSEQVKRLCDRRTGIGCDQLIVMESSPHADVFMRIYNADGGEVATCGNASRCVGWLVMNEGNKKSVSLDTKGGKLSASWMDAHRVTVDMGKPRLDWKEIPLSHPVDTLHLQIGIGAAQDPVGVSMGNPHAVFFVDNVTDQMVRGSGSVLEHHALFPERANISFATVKDRGHIQLRVWERGAGETLACGSGACATLVAAVRRGLAERSAKVSLLGGDLWIEWLQGADEAGGSVLMSGPVAVSFHGECELNAYDH